MRASALLALAIASGCALPLPDKPVRPAAYDLGAPATAPAAAATTARQTPAAPTAAAEPSIAPPRTDTNPAGIRF